MKDIPRLVWQLVGKIEYHLGNIKLESVELNDYISGLEKNFPNQFDRGQNQKEILEKLKFAEGDLKRLEEIIPEFRRRINNLIEKAES